MKLCENGFGNLTVTDFYLSEELEYFILEFKCYIAKANYDVCLHQYFNVSVFNIVWRFMAGGRFNYDDPALGELLGHMDAANAAVQLGANPGYAFPFLRFIPGLTEIDDLKICSSQIHEFFRVSHLLILISAHTKHKPLKLF
jgi:hypothetical protein